MLESESNCPTDLECSERREKISSRKRYSVSCRRSSSYRRIALASRQVLGMPCLHQIDLDAAFFQNVLEWDSIHLSRLQGHGFSFRSFVTSRLNDADLLWIKSGV
jgi:hypothetical protein